LKIRGKVNFSFKGLTDSDSNFFLEIVKINISFNDPARDMALVDLYGEFSEDNFIVFDENFAVLIVNCPPDDKRELIGDMRYIGFEGENDPAAVCTATS
jgi:hypothetical protein